MLKKNSKFYFVSFFMILTWSVILVLVFYFFWSGHSLFMEVELFSLNSVSFCFILYVDWISLLFMSVVLVISSLIIIYSSGYMGKECHRFLWLTFLFIVFMLIMILSPSVLGVILGWDGLGLISFCLVIYYQSLSTYNSGFITAASNRVGDTMIILSIAWASSTGGFMFWESYDGMFFFMLACFTKSAQVPFSAWLPAAMAAPTPISSLVHSSTLVTAGVYMMIRFYECLLEASLTGTMLVISLTTILVAGVSALQEFDMKRLVAFSTLGQLGFMTMILSLGYLYVAFFHLLIHALFKALLFMCTGFIIHSSMGIQDLRKMGSLLLNPLTSVSLNISMFSLMGLPFSSGFYSKDSLLELTLCSYSGVGLGIFMLLMALVTIAYSVRVVFYFSSLLGWTIWIGGASSLSIPIGCLAAVNVVSGGILNWIILELNLVCLGYSKYFPLVMLALGIAWHGKINLKVKSTWVFSSLVYMNSLTKGVGVMVDFFFVGMKMLDQGWAEGTLTFTKLFSLKTSLLLKKFSEGSLTMVSSGVILVSFLLI
uniref:NADH-ubiquinone oxidoreductase chain 5 n=1 Tax=Cacopsylla coccinea TaxID=1646117 RepID=A0A0U2A0T9_CACCO|nr:NADH dehydrogenase subunit 5 [Cacopsylla coccinea]AKE49763.1 NADH dehydrogenase subunit 5 [Cacopsylla coccinea]